MADAAPPPAPTAGSFVETDRAYRLRRDEYVPDAIRRIAGGQLEIAHDRLSAASPDELGAAVHEARKSLKRLRACVRVSRGALGERGYRRENTVFRMAGRQLSAARDARVLVDTLGALEQRFPAQLAAPVTLRLRARLEEERERALATLRDDDRTVEALLHELASARTRAAEWTFEADGFDALQAGLRRIYRRGRKCMRAARKDPTAEHLHDLRKRVKDLWHASQILRPVAPKRMSKLSKRAHRVADLLGDDHDLAVLRDYVDIHPQAFAGEAAKQALLDVIARRRVVLQRKALKRAKRLYAPSPARFVGAIGRGWRKRMARRPQPVTG